MKARRPFPLQNPKRKITWDEIRWSRRPLEISLVNWTMATNPAVSDKIISIYLKNVLSLNILLRHSWSSHTFAFTQTTGHCKLIMPSTDVVGIGGITIKLPTKRTLNCYNWFTTLELQNIKRFILSSWHLRYYCCQRNKSKESYPLTRTTKTIFISVSFECTHNFLRLIWVIIYWNCYILLCTLCTFTFRFFLFMFNIMSFSKFCFCNHW